MVELYVPAHEGVISTPEFREKFDSEQEARKFAEKHFGYAVQYKIRRIEEETAD